MKGADLYTREHFGVPEMVLMERASLVVRNVILKEFPRGCKVTILAGKGNNGGDGVCVGRLLFLEGYDVQILLVKEGDSLSESLRKQLQIAKSYGILVREYKTSEQEGIFAGLKTSHVLVDALFGTGLNRPLSAFYTDFMKAVNELRSNESACDFKMISVDMPSGINAGDGQIMGDAIRADYTVSFGFIKCGQLLFPGREYCGKLILGEMGITSHSLEGKKPAGYCLETKDLKQLLPKRSKNTHKGNYGKVLVIAGSFGMAGAAAFAAAAAYRTGCGLVRILTPEENREILQNLVPEAVLSFYTDKITDKEISDLVEDSSAVIIGPGLGKSQGARRILSLVLENGSTPVVCDADGINLLSENPSMLLRPHGDIVLTPHLGEFSRLTGQSVSLIENRPMDLGQEFVQQYQVGLILKGATSLCFLPYEPVGFHTEGNSGMATAGSGDVLSGILGALLAQGASLKDAMDLGVMIHGLAGQKSSLKCGEYGMIARDLVVSIPDVLRDAIGNE